MDMPIVRLEDLRREIDEIDAALLDLLTRRVDIGRRVAEAKRLDPAANTGGNLRPGREAQVLNRVLSNNQSVFRSESLVRIWREILSANLGQQIEVTAAVHVPEGDEGTALLARDYCAGATKVRRMDSASAVLQALRDGESLIGILPAPSSGGRWWRGLCDTSDSANQPRIIARLPFCGAEASSIEGEAFILATMTPEPSGKDVSLFAIAKGQAPDGAVMVDDGDSDYDLVQVDGFHDGLPQAHWIGSFALPALA